MDTKEPFVIESNLDKVPFTFTKLVDESGAFHQSINVSAALSRAKQAELDLVCFNEPSGDLIALCKIINYGKWKYMNEKAKKKNEKKSVHCTKTIRFSPVISSHDINHKIKQIKDIIDDGDTVIVEMLANTKNRRQMYNADEKLKEIMCKCGEFSKEISRSSGDNQIAIKIVKL